MGSDKVDIGVKGENLAVGYIVNKLGYEVIERNFIAHGFGELDIIALNKDKLVFFEVKTRSSKYLNPHESVDDRKINKLYDAIYVFLDRYFEFSAYDIQLDVLSILYSKDNTKVLQIKHFEDISNL